MKKEMKGKITISRWTGGGAGISIDIEDGLSGVRVLSVYMTPEDFGNAITGLGYVDCKFRIGGVQYVGMRHEVKEVFIPLKNDEFLIRDPKRQAELLAPYEFDGWKGRAEDLANQHRRFNNTMKVIFERYVKEEENA